MGGSWRRRRRPHRTRRRDPRRGRPQDREAGSHRRHPAQLRGRAGRHVPRRGRRRRPGPALPEPEPAPRRHPGGSGDRRPLRPSRSVGCDGGGHVPPDGERRRPRSQRAPRRRRRAPALSLRSLRPGRTPPAGAPRGGRRPVPPRPAPGRCAAPPVGVTGGCDPAAGRSGVLRSGRRGGENRP